MVLRAALESERIPTFTPDEMMKVVDPFITGANPFAVELRVPRQAVAEAQEIVAALPPLKKVELSGAEREARDVARLSQQVRWCLVIPLAGWLVGSFLGFRYLAAALRLRDFPDHHRTTVIIWCTEMFLLVASFALRVAV